MLPTIINCCYKRLLITTNLLLSARINVNRFVEPNARKRNVVNDERSKA